MSKCNIIVATLCVGITLLFTNDVQSQHNLGQSCSLEACYPKLTTNSSKLNALLVFGIFEVSLHEKCLSFAQADECFKSVLSSCHGPNAMKQGRKFHIDSWLNAKKLFDFVCVDEYIAFNENQICLKKLALSSGIQQCDAHFSFKTAGNDMCDLPSTLSRCVEVETNKICPGAGGSMVPKIVKMVDMFLNDMLNINISACSSNQATSKKPKSHELNGSEINDDLVMENGRQHLHHTEAIQRQVATDPPVHNFVVTRRRHGSRHTTRRRKNDEDDDDDYDIDDINVVDVGHYGDRWYHGNQESSDDKTHQPELPRHHPKYHQRGHLGSGVNNATRIKDDEDDEFSRRHHLKQDQLVSFSGSGMALTDLRIITSSLVLFVTFQ